MAVESRGMALHLLLHLLCRALVLAGCSCSAAGEASRGVRNAASVGSAKAGGVHLAGTYEIREGVDVVWQIPLKPKAVLFIAHEGDGSATTYWDPHPNCSRCDGLPENRAITLAGIARGYAVITIKSVGSGWMYTGLEANQDLRNVKAILSSWRQGHGLVSLPLTASGASSGGRFVALLAMEVKLFALVIMISGGDDVAIAEGSRSGRFPPTLFVQMPLDAFTAAAVFDNKQRLLECGVPALDARCFPFPLYEGYFSERIVGLSAKMSAGIFLALKNKGYLNEHNYVKNYEDWWALVDSLRVLPRAPDGTLLWGDGVVQELRLAHALHCVTSLRSSDMFDWLDGRTWASWHLNLEGVAGYGTHLQ